MDDRTEISHDDATVSSMARDPEFASAYFNAVLADGDDAEFAIALGRLIKAKSAMRQVAEASDVNVRSLYRTLSREGNPQFRTMLRVLRSLGFQLTIENAPPAPEGNLDTVANTIIDVHQEVDVHQIAGSEVANIEFIDTWRKRRDPSRQSRAKFSVGSGHLADCVQV